MLVALTLAACGTGAPSVHRDSTPTPASTGAISAPTFQTSGAIDPPASPPTVAAVMTATAPPATEVAQAIEPTAKPTTAPEATTAASSDPTPRPEAPVPADPSVSDVFEAGTSGRQEIAFTFDAGADRGFTEQILDTLKEYGIVASFGITGHWASENPDLVRRMVEEGHQVFNHTWSHESFTGFSTGEGTGITDSSARADELTSTNDEIGQDADGYDTRPYWRPPYGDLDDSVLADVAANGYTTTVMWSCDTLGWDGNTVDQIIERCATDASPGDIILMHVGDGSQDANALPQMIEDLQAQGFTFVTIEQLLQP
jgi:peptidoglycan/xylan/chitin deacetylase (PgdA/CDA1 family)